MGAVDRRGQRGGPGTGLAVLLVLAVGCRDEASSESGDGPMTLATSGGSGGEPSTGEVYEPSEDAADQCDRAPVVGAGRHHGSLRGNAAELDGACGLGGPDAFFRVDVPRRSDVWLQGYGAGFVPRVGVLPYTCTTDWTHRTLACAEGVGTWLLDVAPGSSLVVSVGVDPDHPVLDAAPSTDGIDPLKFALDVGLRNVLDLGDACEPSGLGRCGSGSACLPAPAPADDPEATPGPAVCTALSGDTCQTAVPLPVATGSTVVEIDPATPQTDAHVHSCGGARRRERVLRLELPGVGPHALEIRTDHAEVGLALRAPGCLPEQERGCVDDDAPPAVLEVEVEGFEAFLFVELPPDADEAEGGSSGGSSGGDGSGEEAPIMVEVVRSEPSDAPP